MSYCPECAKLLAENQKLRKILDEIGVCDHAHDLFIEAALTKEAGV